MSRKIGIEIEAESLSVSLAQATSLCEGTPHWVAERDGSLRGQNNSWEIKTAGQGLPFPVALASLSELYPVMRGSSGVWRAAVHVHVDVSDLPAKRRALALCLAYVFDQSIFAATSPERVESNFCVPLYNKRSSVFATIGYYLSGGRTGAPSYGKYSSVNAASMSTFGTIEFRHLRTPRAGDSIDSVTAALDSIKKFARIAHAIVDHEKHIKYRSDETMVGSFLSVVHASAIWERLGISPCPEAVMDILGLLNGVGRYNMTDYDLGTLVRVAPQIPRPVRYESEEEYDEDYDPEYDQEEDEEFFEDDHPVPTPPHPDDPVTLDDVRRVSQRLRQQVQSTRSANAEQRAREVVEREIARMNEQALRNRRRAEQMAAGATRSTENDLLRELYAATPTTVYTYTSSTTEPTTDTEGGEE